MKGTKVTVCTPAEFENVVISLLKQYGDEVYGICKVAAKAAGREATSELKSQSPKNTGKYARGWTHKSESDGLTRYTEIVYNRGQHSSVAHLLEYPHGNYPKNVDYTGMIADVEEKCKEKFMEDIKKRL